MFEKLLNADRPIFVCATCKLERFGNEDASCGHPYSQFIMKGGTKWKEMFEKAIVDDDVVKKFEAL